MNSIPPLNKSDSFRCVAGRDVVELELGHPYEVDRDLRFEDFPMLVTVRNLDKDTEAEQRRARTIAAALDKTGHYTLMVVFDLQRADSNSDGTDRRPPPSNQ